MKTVRFSQVVQRAGKPEVYLLFSADDPVFAKALQHERVMTLVERGSTPPFGLVGHEAGQHGQLLVFPRSLKEFADARVVGIKFDLLAQPSSPPQKKKAEPPSRPAPKRGKQPPRKSAPPPEKKPPAGKVIEFPAPEETPETGRIGELKKEARHALQSLDQDDPKGARRHLLRLLKS